MSWSNDCAWLPALLILTRIRSSIWRLDSHSNSSISQKYDQVKWVVAYTRKPLNSVELKFSDWVSIACYCMGYGTLSSYTGGHKIIIKTSDQPVSFLNSQRLREGRVTNHRIVACMMAFQGYDVEVKYTQNQRMPLGQVLAECKQGRSIQEPQQYKPSPKTGRYVEVAVVLVVYNRLLKPALNASLLPLWMKNGLKNARGRDFKNVEQF